MWGGPPAKQAATQDAALRTLKSLYPDDTTDGGVLIGYSLGAQAALAILAREPGHWRALMIVNSSNVPTPEQITRSGIHRIALVAGDNDGTAGKLSISAKHLKSAGFDAQYFSLGKVGHFFDGTTSAKMIAPLTWAME